MKLIPRIIVIDYLICSLALFLFLVVFQPFNTQAFFLTHPFPVLYCIPAAVAYFLDIIICELLVSRVFRMPADFSRGMDYQLRRIVLIALPCIVLNALFNWVYFSIVELGWDNWRLRWFDDSGSITFGWFSHELKESALVAILVVGFYAIITFQRIQKKQIEELLSLNALLEAEQASLRVGNERKDAEAPRVTLRSDSRDVFVVNPLDVMYVESVGNYLCIAYFDDSELCQKRLRSSLKDVEEALCAFPFMVHIHRAFLVNINYITHVSGNAAGYKLQMFSTDRVLNVSKANVATFRDKIKDLGKVL